MKKTSILAVAIAILGTVWILAMAACTAFLEMPWKCWGSVICTIAAVLAAEIYLMVFRKEPGEQETEYDALGIVFTVCYVLLMVILNSIFVLQGRGSFNWLLLTLNLLAMACYVVLLLWAEKSVDRINEQLVKTEKKTAPCKELARKLGELLAITDDAEIRGKLLKLKEAVDYGSNISTDATASKEAQMNEQLDELLQLTIGRADRIILLNKADEAEMTWRMRSSAAASDR